MHVHGNQLNPNIQLNALDAAERAAAQQEAAETRRKLREFAAKVAGEGGFGEDCVVKLGTRQEPQDQSKQQDSQKQGDANGKRLGTTDAADKGKSVSEWA